VKAPAKKVAPRKAPAKAAPRRAAPRVNDLNVAVR
jgi:hypothetical protein